MRSEPGVVIIDSTSDLLSLRCPTTFKVMRNQFMSAWHYLLYMKAMRLQFYGTADRMLAIKELDELQTLAAPLEQASQDRWLQNVRFDLVVANSNRFQSNVALLEVLLGTGTQLIVSTTHPGTLWSAPALARDKDLSDKANWIGYNLEGIALMSARDQLTPPRDHAGPRDRDTEPLSLGTRISECWTWDPEFSMVSEQTYDAWVAQIRTSPTHDVIHEVHELMRRLYWDVDIHDPRRVEFIGWVKSALGIDVPPDPALLRSEAKS